MNRGLAVLLGASALLGGCAGVPPSVNPTVEVWNVEPAANTDLADAIVEQVLSLTFGTEDQPAEPNTYSSPAVTSGCWLWCFHGRSATHAPTVSQPVVVQPVAYYQVSQPRPITHASTPATTPSVKPQARPMHVATPKTPVAREHKPQHATHTPAAKPSTPKPSKPAATSKPNKKNDKR